MLPPILVTGLFGVLLAIILPRIGVLSQPPRLGAKAIIAAGSFVMVWGGAVTYSVNAIGTSGLAPIAYSLLMLGVLLVLSAAYDIAARVIPNRLLVILLCVYLVMMALIAPVKLISSVAGGLPTTLLMLCLLFLSRGGFGAGDAKLVSAVGFFVGLKGAVATCAIAFILSAVPALFYLLLGKRGHKFAFAPFIAAAGFLLMVAGIYR